MTDRMPASLGDWSRPPADSEAHTLAANPGLAPRRILIVEGDDARREQLQTTLGAGSSVSPDGVRDDHAALEHLSSRTYRLVIASTGPRGRDGLELVREMRRRELAVAAVLLNGEVQHPPEDVPALGDTEFLDRSADPEQLKRVAHAIVQDRELRDEVRLVQEQLRSRFGFDNVLSKDDRMLRMFELVARMSWSDATVLIEGETGTGKEQLARSIHAVSSRAAGPLVAVNCAALPEPLLGSELFGHEKGAFTNAINRRTGRFELAHGGTLFLDEVGDIPLSMQAQMLRVLQERQFERVGGMETIEVDLRVIAATNRPLNRLVRKKQFRDDLFYRLNVIKLDLPPLRERPGDVPILASYFIGKFGGARGRYKRLSAQALEALQKHPWPGNVRQLENAVERACLTSPGREILPEHLPADLLLPPGPDMPTRVTLDRPLPEQVREMIAALEEQYIRKALQQTQGNVSRCARLCGLSRRSMRAKMVEYKLDKSQFKYP